MDLLTITIGNSAVALTKAGQVIDVPLASNIRVGFPGWCRADTTSQLAPTNLTTPSGVNSWVASTTGQATLSVFRPTCDQVPVERRNGCAGGIARIAEATLRIS